MRQSIKSLVLLQYEPTKMRGKPLRILDSEACLSDDCSARVSQVSAGCDCHAEECHRVEEAVQHLQQRHYILPCESVTQDKVTP